MALNVGNFPVKRVYVGSTPVKEVYVGAEKIWSAKETVQITLGPGTQACDQLRATLADFGTNYAMVTEIPFEIELVGSGSLREMFSGCEALTSVPAMDTSNVTDMSRMFWSCESLTHVPAMDTSQVTDMRQMFRACSSLTDVPDMDTSSVTDMYSMFDGCESLTHVPDLDTSNVTDASYMFYDCSALTDGNVRLRGRNPEVTTEDMIVGSGLTREPFYKPLVKITLGFGNEARDQLRAALTERGLYYTMVKELPFDIELVGTGSTQNMFYDCSSLTHVTGLDTSNVTHMTYMFYGCLALTHVTDLDTSSVSVMTSMFRGCTSLTHVSDMDTSNVTNMGHMFRGCSSLTDVSDMNTGNVTNVSYMFRDCSSLTDGNVRLIGRHPSVNISNMIDGSGLAREPFYNTDGNPI